MALATVAVLLASSIVPLVANGPTPGARAEASRASTPILGGTPPTPTGAPPRPSIALPPSAFDLRAERTAGALAAAGVPASQIRLPYVGRPAEVVRGAVVPGYALGAGPVTPGYAQAPAPAGIAYYGESNTTGTLQATVLNASSVAGSLDVQSLTTLYLDTNTPALWGIQENAVLANVTLAGTPGYEFWTQNAVDVNQQNQTLALGEDTWNFSGGGATLGPNSVLRHDPNGSFVAGLYIGEGPLLSAPWPFDLTLYLNSSVTADRNQELWYNYSLTAAGGIRRSGSYDWIVFNSGSALGPNQTAPFTADGTRLDPVGETNDFELDYGIASFNGATNVVLGANVRANLSYCPLAVGNCAQGGFAPVPAALDFGSETGETSSGLAFTYNGTNETGTAGPFVLRGLWGYSAEPGSAAGSTPVINSIAVSGSPLPLTAPPYVFVFFQSASGADPSWSWAPDVPVWHLAPGTYRYELLLADYAEQSGTLTVGASPVALSATLPYRPSSGVYTPLWAFSNAQLAGIASAGNGTLASQYVPFDNPTSSCTACGSAPNDNLSGLFFSFNDYLYPTYSGILFDGTTAYVDLQDPVSFCTEWFAWGPVGPNMANVCFDLQLAFVSVQHLTLAHANITGGWPAMFEVETTAFGVDPTQNFFPQADVTFWNSSENLVLATKFVPTITVPSGYATIGGQAPSFVCYIDCVAPDALLLYGGSHNTVWGSTFRDPTVPSTGTEFATWAGLAEAESGDLIYNNNFSIDNPVVYLPFDIFLDACPDGYAGGCGPLVPPTYSDAWNVTPQPADRVSNVVNGFALSGNILGSGNPVQGGNFWSGYGNALNPVGRLPFVNTFNYSDYAGRGVLPPGTPTVHPSILVGGDADPLLPPKFAVVPVVFAESGLPPGTRWSVTLDGEVLSATSAEIEFQVPNGSWQFRVAAPAGFVASPAAGTVVVNGTLVSRSIQFVLASYTVAFVESGLPNGTSWSVTLGNRTLTGTNATIVFAEPRGVFPYTIADVAGWHETTLAYAGTVDVNGSNVTAPTLAFFPFEYGAFVGESGLPAGTLWTVNLTGGTYSGNTASIDFSEPNGTYSFSVWTPANYTGARGSYALVVAGGPGRALVGFNETFAITFDRPVGASPGNEWTVYLNGTTADGGRRGGLLPQAQVVRSTTAATLRVLARNGTYTYAIEVAGQPNLAARGSITVQNAPVLANPPSPPPAAFLGFPGTTGYLLLAAIVAIVVALTVLVVLRIRRSAR